ncbi:presenilins-associated rhomboid-like protein, mitochondrial [Monomorium pharaonis]|uniref:presenilins-associated rhomboid-like protein, mitochondrial n=1 Tax=Monomorium pharaonis TaxID=307658 RepID=UPI00063EDBBA|nr:presenilins-associated rhomboid-like protein, mitochondrial [Monomorium pharaonis]
MSLRFVRCAVGEVTWILRDKILLLSCTWNIYAFFRRTRNSDSMMTRTLLRLGDTSRCVFTTAQYYRPKMQVLHYRQIRSLKKSQISFRSESPFPNYVESGTVPPTRLLKHLSFTIMFSGASIMGAAIWEYERIRNQTYQLIHRYRQFRVNRTGWRAEIETWWRNLTEGQKIFVPICFINAVVFLAWRMPALQRTMVRYFSVNPASSMSCWSMVLATFSHYSLFHLAANMFVLHSFSTIAVAALGKEQFVALYLSSGVISSFVSNVYKTVFRIPGYSLGASGAILGIIGFVCTQYPDIRLSIIFLPMFTFTAGMALKGLIALDTVGCILRWKYFDHAAHLGGALFGIFWQAWGSAYIWQKREPLLTFWHELREPRRSQ